MSTQKKIYYQEIANACFHATINLMKAIPKTFGFLFLLATTTNCASQQKVPDYLQTGKHYMYPPERYLTAVGQASDSFNTAETNARAALAHQIRSRLESECEDIQREIAEGRRGFTYQSISCSTVLKGSFAYNELIKIAPKLSGKYEGMFYAFAFLDRQEANDVLTLEYKRTAGLFREKVNQAKAHTSDLLKFAPIYRDAKGLFESLLQLGLQIRTIRGGLFDDFVQDQNLFASLELEASKIKSSMSVTVAVTGFSSYKDSLVNAVVSTIEGFNLKALAGDTCDKGLLLKLTGAFQCKAWLGVSCVLSVRGELCLCNTSSCTSVVLSELKGHDRSSEDAAKKAVFRDNERLEKWREDLFTSISSFVPL